MDYDLPTQWRNWHIVISGLLQPLQQQCLWRTFWRQLTGLLKTSFRSFVIGLSSYSGKFETKFLVAQSSELHVNVEAKPSEVYLHVEWLGSCSGCQLLIYMRRVRLKYWHFPPILLSRCLLVYTFLSSPKCEVGTCICCTYFCGFLHACVFYCIQTCCQ